MILRSTGNDQAPRGSVDGSNFPKQLPKLTLVRPSERLELFARKLHACCTTYTFLSQDEDEQARDIKLSYLQEISEYIGTTRGVLTHEPIYALTVVMLSKNIFRTFPYKKPDYDPDEEDAIMYPSWPHLEVVYQYFLQVLEAADFQPSVAKKYFDSKFVARLLRAFASDDYRERAMLKSVLHKIYGKFLGLRAVIRKEICFIFLSYLYEDEDFTGIAEILEILGSIITGFVCPLKPEHLMFLNKVLIPLHSSRNLTYFQPQLVYCIVQFMEKDSSTAKKIFSGLLRFWPKQSTAKEVMYLGEMEELIDALQPSDFAKLQTSLLQQLARCVENEHFQVAERALFFWDNEYFLSLLEVNASQCYPIILGCLMRTSHQHWNDSIQDLARAVLKTLEEINRPLYASILGVKESLGFRTRVALKPDAIPTKFFHRLNDTDGEPEKKRETTVPEKLKIARKHSASSMDNEDKEAEKAGSCTEILFAGHWDSATQTNEKSCLTSDQNSKDFNFAMLREGIIVLKIINAT